MRLKVFLGGVLFSLGLLVWAIRLIGQYGIVSLLISGGIVSLVALLLYFTPNDKGKSKEKYVSILWRTILYCVGILFLSIHIVGCLFVISNFLGDSMQWWLICAVFVALFYLGGRMHHGSYYSLVHLFSYMFIVFLSIMIWGFSEEFSSIYDMVSYSPMTSISLLSTFKCLGICFIFLIPYELVRKVCGKKSYELYSVLGNLVGLVLLIVVAMFLEMKGSVGLGVEAWLHSFNSLIMGTVIKRLDIWVFYFGIICSILVLIAVRSYLRFVDFVGVRIWNVMSAILLFAVTWVLWTVVINFEMWLMYYEVILCICGYVLFIFIIREVV